MRRLAALAAVVSMIAAPAAGLATVVAMSASLIAPPAAARADGDPASDVLIGQDVFLPYSPISPVLQRRLYAVTAAARRAGYPLKVALIGSKSDLGVVPALFGKPGQYARFLSSELTGIANGPVLVVMPAGFGLAASGSARSVAGLSGIRIAAGTDGLATAAVSATERLAAAAGHPLPAGAASALGGGSTSAGASTATVRGSLIAIGVLCLVAAVALVAAVVLRARRTPAA